VVSVAWYYPTPYMFFPATIEMTVVWGFGGHRDGLQASPDAHRSPFHFRVISTTPP